MSNIITAPITLVTTIINVPVTTFPATKVIAPLTMGGLPGPAGIISGINLPTSSSGLNAGDPYTQTATELGGTGTTKVVCIA